MKVRTEGELIDFLANNSQRRKRELISVNTDLKAKAKNYDRSSRTAVVFAYAHWEGFVKDSARAYVNFVVYKSRPIKEFVPAFQALASRNVLLQAEKATKKLLPHIRVVKSLIDELDQSCSIDSSLAIDTESNLTSHVFENICLSVGLNYEPSWSTFGPFMDDMYRTRCEVAHGELVAPARNRAIECVDFTIKSIDAFSSDITNSAVTKSYLR